MGVFCKKIGKWGRGCKKVENEGYFVKKVENEGVFCKKWTFPQRRVHYVQYQYFYFTFYLFGGGYAPNAPLPLPTGLHLCKHEPVQLTVRRYCALRKQSIAMSM